MSRFFALTWLLLFPLSCWARIPIPEGTEDIPYLAESASSVFHARVVRIESSDQETEWRQAGIATLAVYRWYKGDPRPSTVRLRFSYDNNSAVNGHDCIDLRRSSTWLIFANQTPSGLFEFSHDCQGGLPMGSICAPSASETGLKQLQQDLIAGLSCSEPDMRLANIARLGGLKLTSASDARHSFIEHGTEAESKWATYAALRSGDLSILPEVETIAIDLDHPKHAQQMRSPTAKKGAGPAYGDPEGDIVLELRNLRDAQAVPALIKILESAKTAVARGCAVQALQNMRDPRSLPSVVHHLTDSDSYVRYNSLVTIMYITQQPECTLPHDWKESDIPAYVDRCKKWWETSRE